MGKAPAFQFYPMDWLRDLEEHPLEIEGAWIRICCKLWWGNPRGELTRTLVQWSRILRENKEKTLKVLTYLKAEKIADINDNLTQPNGNITVISRRMVRDEKERKNNKLRQRRHYYRSKDLVDGKEHNEKLTPPSSSSTSSSLYKTFKSEVDLLIKGILKNNPNERTLKPDKLEKTRENWSAEIDKMVRLDSRVVEEIREVITWVHWEDDFWYQNIRSGAKLREKFDDLVVKMKKKKGVKQSGEKPKFSGIEKEI